MASICVDMINLQEMVNLTIHSKCPTSYLALNCFNMWSSVSVEEALDHLSWCLIIKEMAFDFKQWAGPQQDE